ncbi:MAG: PTS system mannose/fructose/sorbose family transporter subunit IID [Elusimicrobium sp.]|jgi:PTS system mannose-specific IID component|nr:PTS system mannose/fructose/sorbose family transporter subunit IID [Elusimicrobium sp.]
MKFKNRLVIFLRSLFLQAGWNYLRFQGFGFAFTMLPFLRNLYQGKNLDAAVIRYMETFNTNPVMAVFCYGALAKLEEEVALAPVRKTSWRVVKTFLTSSVASIGDRLFWDALRPLSLVFGVFCAFMFVAADPYFSKAYFTGAQAAVLFAVVLFFYNAVTLYIKWKGLKVAYQGNRENTFGLLAFNWNRLIRVFKMIGFVLTAGLAVLVWYKNYTDMSLSPQFLIYLTALIFIYIISGFASKYNIPNIYIYFVITFVIWAGIYFI